MLQQHAQSSVHEQTVELISARVSATVRKDIDALLTAFIQPQHEVIPSLTVEQVAARLGVARSTVYAHWREWGGYKLSSSPKAPIRFNPSELPARRDHAAHSPADERPSPKTSMRRHTRRGLIEDAPRLIRTEVLLDGHA